MIKSKQLLLALSLISLFSCKNKNDFSVSGNVEGADKSVVYLEQIGMNEISVLDSTQLSSSGNFEFTHKRPEFAPEFYRIRLKNQVVNFTVDSTEEITLKTKLATFGDNYTVEGSSSSADIQYYNKLATKTKLSIDSLFELKQKRKISVDSFQQIVHTKIVNYKTAASAKIFQDPKSPASYFALLQRIYSYMIFDPMDKQDLRVFGAVATSFDLYYSKSPRTKHLKDLTLQAMSSRRQPQGIEIPREKLNVKGVFEIELPDIKGNIRKLTSLTGHPVVLCFTAYQAKFSPALNMALGEIYAANKSRGVEVFQVSVDNDENFWKVSASNLPWVCVRDASGTNSQYLQTFNVTDIPTIFLINSAGDLVKRVSDIKNLKSDVSALK